MRNQDWSLVFFTTMAQWSVGIILCLTLLAGFFSDTSVFRVSGLSLANPVFLALIFIAAATLVSFLHLGSPSNAPNALKNLSGSWLSREILAISVYSLSLLAIFVLGWRTGSIENFKYILMLASVAGLALIWMMIRIYVMPTIPAWNSWYTPLSFVSTALSMGMLTVMFLQHTGYLSFSEQITRLFLISVVVILFMELTTGFIHQFKLEEMDTGIDDLVFNKGMFYKVFLFRMALLIAVFPIIFIILFKPDFLPGFDHYVWAVLVLILVFTQEIIGRLLFYSSYFRIGV